MNIRGTCTNCGREFVPELVVGAGGHCPWCGRPFNPDYTILVMRALQQAEEAGDALETALKDLAEVDAGMELDEDSVLEPLRQALRSLRRRRARV